MTISTQGLGRDLWVIVGATATGKSALATSLAQRRGLPAGPIQIINADASQLYTGMDIGTAKPSAAERAAIAHHLLDVLDVRAEASVAAYQSQARAAIDRVCATGGQPLLVGGSGLYVRAGTDLLEIPPTDPQVRARLAERARQEGAQRTYQRLQHLDAAAADAIEPNNVRRLVRALEVWELTGQPFLAHLPARTFVRPTRMLGLYLDRAVLDERIAARAAAMFGSGLLEEVRGLLALGLREGTTAPRAIGYAQALNVIDGHCSLSEAITATAAATRRLARRQESWFRADPRITWLPADAPDLLERAEQVFRDQS